MSYIRPASPLRSFVIHHYQVLPTRYIHSMRHTLAIIRANGRAAAAALGTGAATDAGLVTEACLTAEAKVDMHDVVT